MNVLVIPEDSRKDEHMLAPIISALFRAIGKKNVKVRVCTDPILGGIGQALKWERINEIIDMYKGMVSLFLLCVDRDGKEGRRRILDGIETAAQLVLDADQLLIAENAWQEIEVWVLAGLDLPSKWNWKTIRAEEHPKEAYYLPLAEQRGLLDHPWEGRRVLATEAITRYKRIRSRCAEDVGSLETRIRNWIGH